ncbi:hypothetical protein [Bythopirellula polymerisocia]|uniref:Lipocalin-like domain-containing protein n=1 Tax=Bythopirellula polymerisocia TaxID=2528003 RepID=A0A5C6CTD0_9BACT|nr:hypothetical protein [Bythopirellula polymerisocia]TWU27648.1 hypothetical protein Pla144_24250 [Bythopirellula polymerisocia]
MIEGTWKRMSGEQNGLDEPVEEVERARLEIVGNQHIITVGEKGMKGTHKLDPTQTPMRINSTDMAGPFSLSQAFM